MTLTTTTAKPATERQITFLTKLLGEKDLTGTAFGSWTPEVWESLSTRQASSAIDYLMSLSGKAPAGAVTEEGMYSHGGEFYRVVRSGSGNLYAKHLVRNDAGNWNFEYAAGAVRSLTVTDRMSLEQAKAFGIQFSTCCVCSKELTDPKSVAAGIGPVCAKRV